MLVGSETPTRDLALTDVTVDEIVFVEDVVHFEFRLAATGFAGRPVKVVLREKGKEPVLAEMTVKAGPRRRTTRRPSSPTDPPRSAGSITSSRSRRLPDEIQTGNNRQERHVIVRKEQIRVLPGIRIPATSSAT